MINQEISKLNISNKQILYNFVTKIKHRIQHENLIAISSLFILIFIFNYPCINIDLMMQDDYVNYSEAIHDEFNTTRFRRSLTNSLVNQIFVNIMEFDISIARLLILTTVMIPSSLLFYTLLHKYFQISKNVSYFSAILPQILPSQIYIPFFIVGSYNTWGIFFYLISIYVALNYLKNNNYLLLIIFTFIYFFSIDVTINVFLSIPLALLLIYYQKINRKHIILFILIFSVTLFKTFLVLWRPWATTTANTLTYNQIIDRGYNVLKWTAPAVANIDYRINLSIFLAIILLSLLLALQIAYTKKEISINSSCTKVYIHKFLLCVFFCTVLFLCSSIIFAFSKFFSPRYVYPAGFAVSLLLIYSLSFLLERGFIKKYNLFFIIMLTYIILVGIHRTNEIDRILVPAESINIQIKDNLQKINFPYNSQIVIVGNPTIRLQTNSFWKWSTGFLQYTTRRADITGLIGPEYFYYDPFDTSKRGYSFRMSGLDSSKPLFIFRFEKSELKQLSYYLRWTISDDTIYWKICRLDNEKGEISSVYEGVGVEEYKYVITMLNNNGISTKDILWSKESIPTS